MREKIDWEVEGAGREWSDCKTKQTPEKKEGSKVRWKCTIYNVVSEKCPRSLGVPRAKVMAP